MLSRARSLMMVDRLLNVSRKRLFQSFGLYGEGRNACARAGQDQAPQSGRTAQRVLEGQPAAPGVAQEVNPIEPLPGTIGVADGITQIRNIYRPTIGHPPRESARRR